VSEILAEKAYQELSPHFAKIQEYLNPETSHKPNPHTELALMQEKIRE
jgi:uncharacterized membrane-anchored protein YhcB (DUF1043 family)